MYPVCNKCIVFNKTFLRGLVIIWCYNQKRIGTSVFGRIKRLQSTTAVLLGTILYKAVLLVAMLWLPSTFLKLTMAILFVAALLTDRIGKKKGGAVHG